MSWPREPRPLSSVAVCAVRCQDCARFDPWEDNPTAAMGRCGAGRVPKSPEPLLWPSAERICPMYHPKEPNA